MSLKYIEFLAPNTLFYKPINQQNNEEENNEFYIKQLDRDLWEQHKDGHWYYCINKKRTLMKQGWKIHISSKLEDAQKVLDSVSDYLIENNISFKFVPSIQKLLFKNSKNGDRASSGKFITIYPNSEEEFLNLLITLENLTKPFERGPYILNDKRWKNTNVFFRYGGFIAMYTKVNGIQVPAIQSPDGEMIPDYREPYYEVPHFINEPSMIKKMTEDIDKELEKEDTSKFDELEIISALHFSNGGGVYKVKKGDSYFVMKEGRSESGLDRLNLDGFKRIQIESKILKELNSKPYTVDFYDYFEIWENNYLIEEYLEGINLKEFVAQNFPFSFKENRKIYSDKMISVINQLMATLEDLHKNDIALGDLQPNNIIILENGKVKLIDLEASTLPKNKYNPGLMTPGYVTKKAETFEQADWFALLKISRFLFLPIENLSDLSIDIENNQDIWIEKHFGENVIHTLNIIKDKALQTVNILKEELPLKSSFIEVKKENTKKIKNEFRKSLINNVNIDTQRLINGDIRQYTDQFGAWNVANGGYGAIMALHRSGALPNNINDWVQNTFDTLLDVNSQMFTTLPNGLFNGLSGIASILYDIGYEDESITILKSLKLPENYKDENLTLYSGLAGIGLNYIAFYSITKEYVFLEKAKHIFKLIKQAFISSEPLNTNDTDSMPYGLLNGWSGVSIFILHISKFLSNDEQYEAYKLSIDILDYEIQNNISINDELNLAQIEEYSLGHKRLIPYLGEGAAGLALIIIEFNKNNPHFKFSKYEKLLMQLANITDLYSTYTSGLFRGAGGMVILANAKSAIYKENFSLSYSIKALGNFILFGDSVGLVTPGEYGYRISMDVQTGISGLLLALNDLDKNRWDSWFPLPLSNQLSIFKNNY